MARAVGLRASGADSVVTVVRCPSTVARRVLHHGGVLQPFLPEGER
jgi:hypothetical protein